MESLDEVVADEILVGYALYTQDDVEVNAGVGEARVADDRLKPADAPSVPGGFLLATAIVTASTCSRSLS